MGADKSPKNTPKFICPNCLPKPKSLGFRWKRLHWASVVRASTIVSRHLESHFYFSYFCVGCMLLLRYVCARSSPFAWPQRLPPPLPRRAAHYSQPQGRVRRARRGAAAIDAFRGTLPSNICETTSTSASIRFVKLSARMREPSMVPFHWDPRLLQPPKKQPWRLLQNNSECANVLWYCLDGQLCQRKNSIPPFVNISQNCWGICMICSWGSIFFFDKNWPSKRYAMVIVVESYITGYT